MKQEMISYIEQYIEDLKELNKYLYNNPESAYNEFKSSKYICDLLEKHNFSIKNKFLDLDTSFYAYKGNSNPKICFLCEYDLDKGAECLKGNNLLTTSSIASAIALGSIIEKIGGSVIVIGCPGESLGGSKSIMVKQGVFQDIDTVLMASPHINTYESGTSLASIPLSISFKGSSKLNYLNDNYYTSLDAILVTINIVNSLLKAFSKDIQVDTILSNIYSNKSISSEESEAKFYIKTPKIDIARNIENKIRESSICVSKLMEIESNISLYKPESEDLITNKVLNRLFSHNLKETGIININPPININYELSLGSVSKVVPCIQPFFSIVNNDNIIYGSKEFSDSTLSDYAFREAMKTSLALAFTGYDIISKENLLMEVKQEFFKNSLN